MYTPENQLGDRLVIARINEDTYLPGIFTGETGQFGEHFEIRFDDILVEIHDISKTIRFHKEDLYESTEQNGDRLL